jgi:menaquinone-dependent protoporphyrinogen oxidase
MTRTLVAYASKHGSTEGVARTIASWLREAGHHVDVRSAEFVDGVEDYDLVVLGGSLYMGRWHGDARSFVRRHRTALEQRVLAVFALGPKTLDPGDVAESRTQLLGALHKLDCEPKTTAIFGGVVDPAKLRFPFNRIEKSDARDWEQIEQWTREVAAHVAGDRAVASSGH